MPVDVTLHEALAEAPRDLESTLGQLHRWAEVLLGQLDADDAELSVLLCDDAAIRALNAEWRDKDAATDVLSFPQGEMPPGAPRILGDVVLSVDTAARQAAELGHPVLDELGVLLTHGLLHLLGHDHQTDEERATMQDEEGRLLQAIELQGRGLVGRARG